MFFLVAGDFDRFEFYKNFVDFYAIIRSLNNYVI